MSSMNTNEKINILRTLGFQVEEVPTGVKVVGTNFDGFWCQAGFEFLTIAQIMDGILESTHINGRIEARKEAKAKKAR
jgi:hypothetical protein